MTAIQGHLWPRWIFLRALGLIYFSAFYSLLFQIKGLIGPDGILPAVDYLQAVARRRAFPGPDSGLRRPSCGLARATAR